MKVLKISLLGVPEVHYQGTPLKFRSRRALALLTYLVAEPGWHSREKLIDLLWWEKDAKQGRTSLRGILTQLRKALQVGGVYVLAELDVVGFDTEQPYQLDLELVAAGVAGAGVADWETAVSQARGDFLEGFNLSGAPEFDVWVSIQREHWHKRLETLYERLACHTLDGGERTKAVSMARRWVAHAPFNDRASRSLMQAYVLVGDRVAALQTYDNFRQVLEQELGILPETETAVLAENIRQNMLTTGEGAHSLQGTGASQRLSSPFVGREDEHRALVAAYEAAVAKGVQAVLITGEPGIGKTYLVDAFLKWVQSQSRSMDVLRGRAFEMGSRLPYQLLVDALRVRLDQENAPEDLLDNVWLAELSQLFPELRSRYPDLPPTIIGDPDLMRARLFEAVTLLVAALAARQPILLFLDDMQWADAGAMDMLKYALHRWSEMGTPILLILTVRHYALLTTPALQEWLAQLARYVPRRQLDLATLNVEDIRQYLRLLAEHDAKMTTPEEEDALQAFGEWLFEKSGGQPFYLSEMVHMLWEQALLDTRKENGRMAINFTATWRQLQTSTQTLIPPSIRDVILARMRGLSEEAVTLLMAAAALGRKSRDGLLYQLANLSEETGLPALVELLNAGFIVEKSENKQPYNISHDTIREVAYTEAGEARRRFLHRRALDTLAQASAPAAELAHHAQAAHLYESAFHYWLQAGDHALDNYSAVDALDFYENARQVSETLNFSDDDLIRLFEQRIKALELAGRYEDALAASREMQTLAKERNSEMIELAAIMAQAVLFIRRTELTDAEQAQTTISEAITLSQHFGDKAAEAKALWCRQQLGLVRTGDFRQAQKDGESALAIAQELDLQELAAYILNDLSRVYTAQLNFPKATEANEAAFQSLQALDNRSMLADNLNYAAEILRKRGNLVAAIDKATEALSIATSIDNRWNIAAAYNRLGRSHFELGHINESIAASTSGISVSESDKIFYHYLEQILLANRFALLGHISRATTLLQDLENVEDTYSRVVLTVTRAYLRFLQGDLASASDLISEVPFDKLKLAYFYAPLYACEIAQASKGYDRALSTCNHYIGMMEQGGHFLGLPNFYYQKSVILLAQDRIEDAVHTLHQALSMAESQRARMILWRVASRLSEIERTQGNVASANNFNSTARSTLEHIINRIDDSELRASFTALPDVVKALS